MIVIIPSLTFAGSESTIYNPNIATITPTTTNTGNSTSTIFAIAQDTHQAFIFTSVGAVSKCLLIDSVDLSKTAEKLFVTGLDSSALTCSTKLGISSAIPIKKAFTNHFFIISSHKINYNCSLLIKIIPLASRYIKTSNFHNAQPKIPRDTTIIHTKRNKNQIPKDIFPFSRSFFCSI